jgi:hypothetical protein
MTKTGAVTAKEMLDTPVFAGNTPVAYPFIRDALHEPHEFVPTLARRLGLVRGTHPFSLVKGLGPASAPRGVPHEQRPKALTLRSAPERAIVKRQ